MFNVGDHVTIEELCVCQLTTHINNYHCNMKARVVVLYRVNGLTDLDECLGLEHRKPYTFTI